MAEHPSVGKRISDFHKELLDQYFNSTLRQWSGGTSVGLLEAFIHPGKHEETTSVRAYNIIGQSRQTTLRQRVDRYLETDIVT